MIVTSFQTEKDRKKVLDKAVEYFVGCVGLRMVERSDFCTHFQNESQLGIVKVMLSQKGKHFEVDVEIDKGLPRIWSI